MPKAQAYFNLQPVSLGQEIDFGLILRLWMKADFSSAKCRDILQQLIEENSWDKEFFRLRGFSDGGMVVSSKRLFSKHFVWRFAWTDSQKNTPAIMIPNEEAPEFISTLRDSSQPRKRTEEGRTGLDVFLQGLPRAGRVLEAPPKSKPGIFRREHACVQINSGRATILVDPVPILSSAVTGKASILGGRGKRPDAILITHSHDDHWDLLSILNLVGEDRDVPIVVPDVKRRNLLCPTNFVDELKIMGQRHIVARWGETIKIKDLTIDVLPFFGEQPTRDLKPRLGLRNIGNCYRVNAPSFSTLLLADAGQEYRRSMVEPLIESFKRRGPVTALLACGRQFQAPFFGGLINHWAAIPFGDLQRLFRLFKKQQLPSVTAGPVGIAEYCKVSGAEYYLPYAHGFNGYGKKILDVSWLHGEPSESQILNLVKAELKRASTPTVVHPWLVGDHFCLH